MTTEPFEFYPSTEFCADFGKPEDFSSLRAYYLHCSISITSFVWENHGKALKVLGVEVRPGDLRAAWSKKTQSQVEAIGMILGAHLSSMNSAIVLHPPKPNSLYPNSHFFAPFSNGIELFIPEVIENNISKSALMYPNHAARIERFLERWEKGL